MALDDLNFLKNFEVEGAWDGIGWGEEGGLGGDLIFQKTWANPS